LSIVTFTLGSEKRWIFRKILKGPLKHIPKSYVGRYALAKK
jgi:hypothetical protein